MDKELDQILRAELASVNPDQENVITDWPPELMQVYARIRYLHALGVPLQGLKQWGTSVARLMVEYLRAKGRAAPPDGIHINIPIEPWDHDNS